MTWEESEESRRLRAENEEMALRIGELSAALESVSEARADLQQAHAIVVSDLAIARAQVSSLTARLAHIQEILGTESVY